MHLPSSMNNTVGANQSVVLYACITANYNVIGTALSADTFENADRLQNTQLGANVDSIIYSVAGRDITGNGILEYAIFKIERADEVPDTTNQKLPTDIQITTQGLQQAIRQFQPGRITKYGQRAFAAEQPVAWSVKGAYKKFNFSKVRAGDYYGILVFNRSSATVTIDLQARYIAYM